MNANALRMKPFLSPGEYVDFDRPEVAYAAKSLGDSQGSKVEIVRSCFEFVRDTIRHSSDFRLNPVTCRASDALRHKTGFCYAKSHLLAALLRANGIPAGFCYQRLSVGDSGPPYCLHGLNAVHLEPYGWIRLDARGNKPGCDARFDPPNESLPFRVQDPHEIDLPEIWSEPLRAVIEVLEKYKTYDEVSANLPDVELWNRMDC